MTPLTAEQALGELRKFAGIQFDPEVVDAFVRTTWVEDVPDPGRTVQPRPIPLISQHANRVATASASGSGRRTRARGRPPRHAAMSAGRVGRPRVPTPDSGDRVTRTLEARESTDADRRDRRSGSCSACCSAGRSGASRTSGCRFLPLLFLGVDRALRDGGAPRVGVPIVDHAPAAAVRPRLRAPARDAVAEPWIPGPRARVRRHRLQRARDHGQRRVHAGLAAGAYEAAGLTRADSHASSTRSLRATLGSEFLLHLGPLGDIIPIPIPPSQNVASIGDLFLTAGLVVLPVRDGAPVSPDARDAIEPRRPHAPPGRGPRDCRPAPAPSAVLDRPIATAPVDAGPSTAVDVAATAATGSSRPSLGPPARRVGQRHGSPGRPVAGLEGALVLERPRMLGGGSVGMARPHWRLEPAVAMDAAAAMPGDRRPSPTTTRLEADPPPPIHPAGPQRLVLGPVGGPGHQPVRRPDQPARADRLRLRDHRLPHRRRRSRSSCRRSRTSCSPRSPGRSSTAGTRSRSSSSRTCCARPWSC